MKKFGLIARDQPERKAHAERGESQSMAEDGEGPRLHKRRFGGAEDGEGPRPSRREALTEMGGLPLPFAFRTRGEKGREPAAAGRRLPDDERVYENLQWDVREQQGMD